MFLHSNRGPAYPPEWLAEDVLRGVERNRSIILARASPRARTAWLANRIAPRLVEHIYARELAWVRRELAKPRA
jgi:hypothetical protein